LKIWLRVKNIETAVRNTCTTQISFYSPFHHSRTKEDS